MSKYSIIISIYGYICVEEEQSACSGRSAGALRGVCRRPPADHRHHGDASHGLTADRTFRSPRVRRRAYISYISTYLWSSPCSWARGHSCLGLRTGVSPHFSTNSMRAMVAAQRQCVIGSERVRCGSVDSAERPAGSRRPPAGWWRARPPPLYSCAMTRSRAAVGRGRYARLPPSRASAPRIMGSERAARRSHRGHCGTPARLRLSIVRAFSDARRSLLNNC